MTPLILVIDDEPIIQEVLKISLTNKGYEYAKCLNGKDAFQMMNDIEFNLVILDLNLPDVSGRDIATYLETNHPNTPIIFITGEHSAEAITLEANCDGRDDRNFLYKPIYSNDIHAAVEKLISHSLKKGMST